MKRIHDFTVAFVLAMLIHVAVGLGIGFCMFDGLAVNMDFKAGDSSIELMLAAAEDVSIKTVPEEAVIYQEEPPEFEVTEEKSPDAPSEVMDVEMLDEGVTEIELSDTVLRPRYPFVSRMRGEEGVVIITATLNSEGRVVDTIIKKTSGHTALDSEALRTLKRAVFHEKKGRTMSGHVVERVFRFQLK